MKETKPYWYQKSAFGTWSENITFGGQTTAMACLVASVIVGITGCEFSTGPGTNASENVVGPVKKCG